MKLKAKILAAAVCAMALCVALVGCAGGGTYSDDNAANFKGDWMLSGGTSDGQELDAESISAMEQMGLYVYLQLKDDGTAVVSLFGTNVEGTWAAKDATTVTLTLQGDAADATLEGEELTLAVEGDSLRFKKGEIPAEALEGASGADAGDAADADAADAGDAGDGVDAEAADADGDAA